MNRLLDAADIHCQPNTRPEAFGITFIEGLMHGLPVVTTALGGALRIVTPSCGRLVPPGDAGELARCLRQLIVDRGLRAELGSAGPDRAKWLCDARTQVAAIANLFGAIVRIKSLEPCESHI